MDLEFEMIRDLELMEENEEIENELMPRRKIPRVIFTDAQNPMEIMNDKSFYDNLAFTKAQFLIVLDKFKDKFAASMSAHSPMVQLTVFLCYVKSNQFLRNLSTQLYIQLPISNIHRILNSVANDIASYR